MIQIVEPKVDSRFVSLLTRFVLDHSLPVTALLVLAPEGEQATDKPLAMYWGHTESPLLCVLCHS